MSDEYADSIEVECLEDQRIIILSGELDEAKSSAIRKYLLLLDNLDNTKVITMHISTYGGDVYEMNAVYDTMQLCRSPIHTVGVGKVMSAGVLILACGDHRSLTENTIVMMHQVSTSGAQGTVADLTNEVKYTKIQQGAMYKLYAKYTGQSIKQLETDLRTDKYLTAPEALEYGIVDDILKGNTKVPAVRKRRRRTAA